MIDAPARFEVVDAERHGPRGEGECVGEHRSLAVSADPRGHAPGLRELRVIDEAQDTAPLPPNSILAPELAPEPRELDDRRSRHRREVNQNTVDRSDALGSFRVDNREPQWIG